MAHQIKMGTDGIVRIHLYRNVDDMSFNFFMNELNPFLQASSDENPLNIILFANEITHFSSSARKEIAKLIEKTQIGKFFIVQPSRETKVLFNMYKITSPQSDIRFFNLEEEAVASILHSNS